VYREVQEFLARVWGGEEDDGEGEGEGEGGAAKCIEEGMGMAGWVQAVMFAADLKGSIAVKVEDLIKIEDSRMGVVQEDPIELGRGGMRVKEEEGDDFTPTTAAIGGSWTVPATPCGVSSGWSDLSPADTALLTPTEGLRGYREHPVKPVKGSVAGVGQLGKRAADEEVVVKQECVLEVATIVTGNDMVDRVKRRRVCGR
jgi:hypothetical protein